MSKKETKYVAFYTADDYNTHYGTVTGDIKEWVKQHNIVRVHENVDEERDLAVEALEKFYDEDDLQEKIEQYLINEHNLDEDTAWHIADQVTSYLDDIDDFTFYEV